MNLHAVLLSALFSTVAYTKTINRLIVQTDSGTYRGLINGSAPDVREFAGIPYAKPPTGELRWQLPQKLETNCSTTFDATRFPPSCPQLVSPLPELYRNHTPAYGIAGPMSEDCLSLSIWTPMYANKLPVIVYLYGGAFQTGGVEVPYQLPHPWVQRTQAHIVVTLNYRLNIFGFPNAAGVESQNLGILDQRAALEWVRDNIEAFGGDSSKITLWGQSAGSWSTDWHNYAFRTDPIVTGFVSTSGAASAAVVSADTAQSNFTSIASSVGCNGTEERNATAEIECMRVTPWETILSALDDLADSVGSLVPLFYPITDEQIVFSNYTERLAEGFVSDRPAIFSSTADEGVVVLPYDEITGVNTTEAQGATLQLFQCPAADSVRLRTEAGLLTYRYLYSGNFSNVSPLPWMGSYHNSDLPMLFGTHEEYTNGEGESTPFQYETSETMQDFLLSFMLDPVNGPSKLGWAPAETGMVLEFGADGTAVQNVTASVIDAGCAMLIPVDIV